MERELIKTSKRILSDCDNELNSFKQKIEKMYNGSHSYSVTYTELVKHECTMTKEEIDKLLVNPCVKSINIILE